MSVVVSRSAMLKGLGVMALGAGIGRLGLQSAVAQGSLNQVKGAVVIRPAPSLTWRVVRDTARPFVGGEMLERALGLVIPNEADLIVTNSDFSEHINKGNSLFISEAHMERQESATDFPVRYARFGLGDPAEATYTAGGELIFGSDINQLDANCWLQLRCHEGRLSGSEAVALPAMVPRGKVDNADRGSISAIGVAEDGSRTGQRQDLSPGEAWVPSIANDPPDHWEVIAAVEVEHATF